MPSVRNFLDTNILVYAFADDPRSSIAQELMAEPFALSVQGLNEFANVMHRKLFLPWDRIAEALDLVTEAAHVIVSIDTAITRSALQLAGRYQLSFYDALMMSAALQAGCAQFHSEDLHHGLRVEEQLSVVNPFR